MEQAADRTPTHLWIVGGLATLWNGFGCTDYLMTRTHQDAWLTSMMPGTDPQRIYSYIEGFPIWASFGWGLGVWLGLAGWILLLLRNGLAVPALGLSFVGAVIGLGYQLMNPADIPAMNEGFNRVIPLVIIAIALGLFLYARSMKAKGVLR